MRIAFAWALLLAMAPAADRVSFVLDSSRVQWQDLAVPGVPGGMQQKLLHDNRQNKLMSAIVRFPRGFRDPRHYHTNCGHSLYILRGRLKSPEGDLTPGMFIYSAAKERHGPFVAVEDTEMLFYTDGPFDYVIDETPAPTPSSSARQR